MALERRYRLLPYFYTKFYDAHKTGIPVMQPLFFTDVKDLRLRTEQQSFLLGEDIMVIPAFAENPVMPYGIWETISLVDGDNSDKYQAKLKIRGGSIVPVASTSRGDGECHDKGCRNADFPVVTKYLYVRCTASKRA